jgi:exodeoxyribonuclease VII large subunit
MSSPVAASPGLPAPVRNVYSVSRLNREARALLESGLGTIWVQGEISNLSRPSSGHWYFTLKDRDAQLRCAMFRTRNTLARFVPKEGQLVLACGRVSVYEPRGDYQLLVECIEDAGLGALQRAFDELKARLAAEGLFAPERKRALPSAPRCIGVITSPSGAAIRDILHVLARRFPAAAVLIYPTSVQGAAAAPALVAAIELADSAHGVRCADSGARRRLARGSLGLQRRARGAGHVPLPDSNRDRHRPRDRLHDRRFRG